MKLLRLLLVVLISVVIPVNGFAAAPVSPCPMQAQDATAATTASMSAAVDDCCLDMDTSSSQGKSCKPGQACSLGGVFFVLPASFQVFPPVAGVALAHYVSPFFSEPTASIWHPPQLL